MKPTATTSPAGRAALIVAVLLGLAMGVSGYTFRYAEGLSYLSSDPKACVNCHIMQSQYDAWQKGSHHAVATCNDCHIPPSGLAKWIAKATHGYQHSKGFTFQDFEEPIRAKAASAASVQENCVRCHSDLLHDQLAGATTDRDAVQCVHCHRGVGHGEQAGMGGRDRGEHHERTEVRR